MLKAMRLFGAALIAAAVMAAAPVRAQAPVTPMSVAVVDLNYIAQNAAAAKAVRTQVDKEEATYRADFNKRNNDLRSAYQELQGQMALLGPDAQRDRRVAFEQRAADFEREVDFRKHDVQNRANKAMKKVEDTLKSVLLDIASERKLTLIIHKEAAPYYNSDMDLTDEAMKRLNAKLPTVKLDAPSPVPKAPKQQSAPKQQPAPASKGK
jgi:Skp family chaperone for outer membrane proteins